MPKFMYIQFCIEIVGLNKSYSYSANMQQDIAEKPNSNYVTRTPTNESAVYWSHDTDRDT